MTLSASISGEGIIILGLVVVMLGVWAVVCTCSGKTGERNSPQTADGRSPASNRYAMTTLAVSVWIGTSLAFGTGTAVIGYRMSRNPDPSDLQHMATWELRIAPWIIPVCFFILGALMPLFFFAALGISRRRTRQE